MTTRHVQPPYTPGPRQAMPEGANKEPYARPLLDMDVPGYDDLARVLKLAYDQAARGKGKERHATDRAFADQPMNTIPAGMSFIAGLGGLSYQVAKKNGEADRVAAQGSLEAAHKEMLGVINYAAAKVLLIEKELRRMEQVQENFR